MKTTHWICGAVLMAIGCAALSAQPITRRSAPTPTASVKIVNNYGTGIRVRLIGYDFASREPIDIPNHSSVSHLRLAAGTYVLVVHSKESREVLRGPAEPIKIVPQKAGSSRQLLLTLTNDGEGKYAVKKGSAPLDAPKYSKFSQKN
jgi:hypothetical protein